MKKHHPKRMRLVDVIPGSKVLVVDFNGMPFPQQESLHAYGMVQGNWVRVLQQSPVTVVEIENTELALESSLASLIQVDVFTGKGKRAHRRRRKSGFRSWRGRFRRRLG